MKKHHPRPTGAYRLGARARQQAQDAQAPQDDDDTAAVRMQVNDLLLHHSRAEALDYVKGRILRFPQARDFWQAVHRRLTRGQPL